MTHKAICYDDEGRLDCCCELRPRAEAIHARPCPVCGEPLHHEWPVPYCSDVCSRLVDAVLRSVPEVVEALEQGFSHRLIAVEFGIDITKVEAVADALGVSS